MIAKKISFTIPFGLTLPGFAISPDAIEYLPGCKPEDMAESTKDRTHEALPAQQFELTIAEGENGPKGVLRSEHGCQKIDDIVESPFSLSFTAYAGSAGDEIFCYVLTFSDSTDQLVGYACGIKPFFRSFMPVKGYILER